MGAARSNGGETIVEAIFRRIASLMVLLLFMPEALCAGAANWVVAAAPGRAGGDFLTDGSELSQPVTALTPFDGRLYIALAPATNKPALSILSYDGSSLSVAAEQQTAASFFGAFRIINGTLYIPADAGYYLSAGDAKWEQVKVDEACRFYDIASFDGKIFLAGLSRTGQMENAVVAWKTEGAATWSLEEIRNQAARISYRACRFLRTADHLAVICLRDMGRDWPTDRRQVAPQEWGAWYVLNYYPKRSVRGFMFDGKARPLPVLSAMAPGATWITSSKYEIMRDQPWNQGLLYLSLSRSNLTPDPGGALYYATVEEGGFLIGRSFMARRVETAARARDVAVNNGTCYMLAATDNLNTSLILSSRDLESWQTVFEEELSGPAICMAFLNNRCFIGMENGTLLEVTLK